LLKEDESNFNTKNTRKNIDNLLFAAVGTARHQHGLEASTVCGRAGDKLLKDKSVLK
jgi:hypothetical protein